jgi:hypothetical protein
MSARMPREQEEKNRDAEERKEGDYEMEMFSGW